MTSVSDIYKYLEDYAPNYLAFERDNVGLIVGRADKKVNKVLLTLDVDENVADEAVEKGCDMIISHHPLMFNPIKHLTSESPMQRAIMTLISNDIPLFSAHTNLDCVHGGLNDYLAEKLGIVSKSVVEVCGEYKGHEYGFGRVGEIPAEITLKDMIENVIDSLKISGVKYVGELNKKVKKIVVNCGGGADEMNWCINNNVDLFITGDVKYNPARDAYENGMYVIDAGHFETEYIVKELFENILSEKFSDVEFIKSEENKAVFNYYCKDND